MPVPAATPRSSTPGSEMRDFPLHTALSILTVGAALFIWHPPGETQWRALTNFTPQLTPLSPRYAHRTGAELRQIAPAPRLLGRTLPPGKSNPGGPLFDDSKGALDSFYRALRHTGSHEPGAI